MSDVAVVCSNRSCSKPRTGSLALNSYRCACMVVGQDERFLAEIGVNRRLRLADAALTESGVPEV
jgi:hypothetical protein